MRRFNTTGLCVPRKHYMVDISGRVAQAHAMVDDGDYFCISRGRQYGKTTTLAALERALANDYAVASLDFQGLSHADFADEAAFVRAFCRVAARARVAVPEEVAEHMRNIARDRQTAWVLDDLFDCVATWCEQSERPVVLIIDEIDSATNNQVFLDFLAQLRLQYLTREKHPEAPTFHSVVLAGVTDVKHLKAKIRPEDQHKVNSPWNIATDFDADMSFSATDIAGMLTQYEADHATGMDVAAVAQEIRDWTSGYPFLASRLCQLVDKHGLPWTREGVDEAARLLLKDDHVSLFESLFGKLAVYPELREHLRDILLRGEDLDYLPYDDHQQQLRMYGFITEEDGKIRIANRVFEMLLYDQFLGEERTSRPLRNAAAIERSDYVRDGRLDMCAVLEGFRRAYVQIYGPPEKGDRFLEHEGRKRFLLFLKPIINGTGNYYIEAQTRDQTRTDVVVDYAGERFVVELKIWRGPRYNEAGERQVADYLEHFGLSVGYMLSFCFNRHKEPGLKRVDIGDKVLWEETL